MMDYQQGKDGDVSIPELFWQPFPHECLLFYCGFVYYAAEVFCYLCLDHASWYENSNAMMFHVIGFGFIWTSSLYTGL